jgi:hypothetical protein
MTNIFPSNPASGDQFTLTLEVFEADGTTPKDLTGLYIGITVRTVPDPDGTDDADAAFSASQAGGPTGVVVFLLGPFAAGAYWLDVKTFATGTPPVRSGLVNPTKFDVVQSVTMRTTP